jgi:hypothetical protein
MSNRENYSKSNLIADPIFLGMSAAVQAAVGPDKTWSFIWC